MHITETPIYRKAFERYLRQGIAPEISIKAWTKAATAHETPLYIWRTVGDDKVRPEHAANDGRIFSWDNPSDTGHPGESINCRCIAEPYFGVSDSPGDLIILLPIGRLLRISAAAIALARRLLHQNRTRRLDQYENMTAHGAEQAIKRNISPNEIREAMKTARETGKITTKEGKYGTNQKQYEGSNGIIIIEETSGRNAGKIITVWRQ